MFKKIAVLLLAAALLVGMVSCGGTGTGKDAQQELEAADFEKFIEENANGVLKELAEVKGGTAEEKAEDYLASYDAGSVKVSDDVLALYKESFKEYFASENLDDSVLTKKATDMIIREMAVYRAYKQLKGKDIDVTNRDAMKKAADEMAAKYGYKAENIYTEGGSTYLVETYLKYEYIVSCFADETTEESSVAVEDSKEESAVEETSEASAEETTEETSAETTEETSAE